MIGFNDFDVSKLTAPAAAKYYSNMEQRYTLAFIRQVPEVSGLRPKDGFNWYNYEIHGPDKSTPITGYKQAETEKEVRDILNSKIEELNDCDIGSVSRWIIYNI